MSEQWDTGINEPSKEGIYFMALYDESGAVFQNYSTAPIKSRSGDDIYEYRALMSDVTVTQTAIDMSKGRQRLPAFKCTLLDKLVQDASDYYGRVSHDLFGVRQAFPLIPHLQPLNRRVDVFQGWRGMDKEDFERVFTGHIISIKMKTPEVFEVNCSGTLNALDVPVFKHLRGQTIIGQDHITSAGRLRCASFANFQDPQAAGYPFDAYVWVERLDGSHQAWIQYAELEQNAYADFWYRSGDPSGNFIFDTNCSEEQGSTMWSFGDLVWEAMSIHANPIEFALWVALTTADGSNGQYDKAVDGFGAGLPEEMINITAFEAFMNDPRFKYLIFRFERTLKELQDKPATALQIIRDDIARPLGLILTTENDGRATLLDSNATAIAGDITDDEIVKPPKSEWDDNMVRGECQIFIDHEDNPLQTGSYQHSDIHSFDGTAEVFPHTGGEKKMVVKSRALYHDMYADGFAGAHGSDFLWGTGRVIEQYFNDFYSLYKEPAHIIEVETHQTKLSFIPGDVIRLSSAFVHNIDQNEQGQRGVVNQPCLVLERKMLPTSVKYKLLWRRNFDWMVDANEWGTISVVDSTVERPASSDIWDKTHNLQPEEVSPVITATKAYGSNTSGATGQVLPLAMKISYDSDITNGYPSIKPRLGYCLQVGELITSPTNYLDTVATYWFELVWDPVAGTTDYWFYNSFILPRKDVEYSFSLELWKLNIQNWSSYNPTETVLAAGLNKVNWVSPL